MNSARYLHEIYTRAKRDYTGRVTVPVLWDKQTATIVNNESSEMIRMLNSAFDQFGEPAIDFYPRPIRADIDAINRVVSDNVNNGVYRCGFATTQAAYEEAFDTLFASSGRSRGAAGPESVFDRGAAGRADWRLFATLVRFDSVYYGHFKCNLRRIIDYPDLWGLTRELYQVAGVSETVDLAQIKRHCYMTTPPSIRPNHTQRSRDRFVPARPRHLAARLGSLKDNSPRWNYLAAALV